ncbi:hypothetical protein EDB87DRAFT_1015862 [Lactarius vividus]|nr:hypothetical protein EDB87DRAFT_1015862 [Lactarius vividus]
MSRRCSFFLGYLHARRLQSQVQSAQLSSPIEHAMAMPPALPSACDTNALQTSTAHCRSLSPSTDTRAHSWKATTSSDGLGLTPLVTPCFRFSPGSERRLQALARCSVFPLFYHWHRDPLPKGCNPGRLTMPHTQNRSAGTLTWTPSSRALSVCRRLARRLLCVFHWDYQLLPPLDRPRRHDASPTPPHLRITGRPPYPRQVCATRRSHATIGDSKLVI